MITVDRETWNRWNGTGEWVLFREGDYSRDLRTRTRQMMQRNGIPQGTTGNEHPVIDAPMHPPVEFVEWAKPCETCVANRARFIGYGWVPEAAAIQGAVGCPDCIDGKRRIAVAVPCHVCEIAGRACVPHQEQGHTEKQYVTVGHVVVEWGPWLVVESWVGARANPHKVACLSHDGFLDWRWSSDDLTLVGQYAIGGKLVTP